ncbi:hypothetical protein [Anaerocolumna aminovalerica]|jgi:hypothetical protein|uniref:hypothetical protein n=1 Tax=Anaerocolumna aminovalerica TaxID=1527 RepID=UPI000BE24EC7|nr:hypothetical protein [Anaerocolumna aminovalerica]MBU5334796.1 hypothetical protein [Anaerocolumna aminovalerica]
MKKAGILNSVILVVDSILRVTFPDTKSSNEIYNLLTTSVQLDITAIASRYQRGAVVYQQPMLELPQQCYVKVILYFIMNIINFVYIDDAYRMI